jgi:hypothetical protein
METLTGNIFFSILTLMFYLKNEYEINKLENNTSKETASGNRSAK